MTHDSLATVRITRHIDASPERVFDAWLEPEKIRLWMLPSSEAVIRAEVDARVGGAFSFVVRRKGEEIDHRGEYLEMKRPLRLVFTWGVPQFSNDSTIVALDFAASGTGGAGTDVTLTQSKVIPGFESKVEKGWNTILDAFVDALGR